MKTILNSDILTEKELNQLKLREYNDESLNNKNLEEFIRSLPYSDEYSRYYLIKIN